MGKELRTSRPRRFLPWIRPASGGILGLVLLGAVACESSPPLITVPQEFVAFDADGIVFGMTHRFTQEGKLEALVRADTAIQWQDSSTVHLRGVDLRVFNEDGSERARVTSARGILDLRTERMAAYGAPGSPAILIMTESSRRLESQEIHYDPRGDRMWSDSAFVYVQGTRRTSGRGFESDIEFRNFQIRGRGTGGGAP
jgi:LPS export ABC transporter protein LptC